MLSLTYNLVLIYVNLTSLIDSSIFIFRHSMRWEKKFDPNESKLKKKNWVNQATVWLNDYKSYSKRIDYDEWIIT